MNHTAAVTSGWGRRTYAVLALAYGVFVIYGSLVPLQFQRVKLEVAWALFRSVALGPITIESRADVATNFLLFIPLAYLVLASLRTDRQGWFGHLAAALGTAAGCAVLTASIEFTQIFFPGRTVALSDMLAETTGGIAGSAAWLVLGRAVTEWARGMVLERERPALVQRLLLLYAVGFVASQLMPLDLATNLGDLAHKYRQGSILLKPFSFAHASWSDAFWDYGWDIVLNAPLGAAAVLAFTSRGSRRRPLSAFALAVMAVGLIELAQVFILSRYADVTDVITGSAGAAVGVMLANAFSTRQLLAPVHRQPARFTVAARLAVPLWLAIMAAYHWAPYDFSLSHEQIEIGMGRLLQVPLLSYFMGTEFHAFTEMARKALLAFPLGLLLGLAWPVAAAPAGSRVRRVSLVLISFVLLCGIEVGQVFLRTRVPDLTDAVIGEVGVIAGIWVAGLVAVPGRDRRVAPRLADQSTTS